MAACQGGATLHLLQCSEGFSTCEPACPGSTTGREIRRRMRPVQAAERTCRPLTHLVVRFVEPLKRVRAKNAPKNENSALEGWRMCSVQGNLRPWRSWRHATCGFLTPAFHELLRQTDAASTLKSKMALDCVLLNVDRRKCPRRCTAPHNGAIFTMP